MGAAREYTAWGTVVGTGAASIDLVLMDATRPLSIREIEDEIRRRGLPERGAVSSHLNTLKGRGHITNTPAGWCRIGLSGGSPPVSATPPIVPRPVVAHSVVPPPTAPPPTAPPPPAPATSPDDRTERLKRIKLVFEIGVVVVALIGGIIALVLGRK